MHSAAMSLMLVMEGRATGNSSAPALSRAALGLIRLTLFCSSLIQCIIARLHIVETTIRQYVCFV
jgi:hypothetical protein